MTHFYLQQSLLRPPDELLGFERNKINELKKNLCDGSEI
jgi:hypothetical protein